jgi:acetyl esterase/lipase
LPCLQDFYAVLMHVIQHAEELGVDRHRVAIAGESGGGYICFGTMVMLGKDIIINKWGFIVDEEIPFELGFRILCDLVR